MSAGCAVSVQRRFFRLLAAELPLLCSSEEAGFDEPEEETEPLDLELPEGRVVR